MLPGRQPKDLLFIDVETTGLDPTTHEVIEIAAMRTSPNALVVRGQYSAKIKPQKLELADPKALQINGFVSSEWSDEKCSSVETVLSELSKLADDCVLIGHNVSFDESFIVPLYKKLDRKVPWSYHKVDTVALAWPLYLTTELEGLSLSKLCSYLGTEAIPSHRAASDVAACRELYVRLIAKYTK